MKRRPKGSVRRRGQNSFELKFDVPCDAGRQTRYVSFRGTKQEALVSPPRRDDTEFEILQPEQVQPALDALKGHRIYPIVALAIWTGMRRGELLALQWEDVDLVNATLTVRRSLEQTAAGLRVKEPKTKKSRRTIGLDAEVVDVLRQHRAEIGRLALALGRGLPDTAPVFTDVEGKHIKPDSFTTDWCRARDARGLPKVRFHDLRHTHASLLLAEGVDVVTVAKRLGHSKPTVTLSIYAHALERADRGAAEAFSRAVKGEKLK
jgi:integrase